MATAANLTTLEIQGTSTAMTAEACSLVAGTTYQVTNSAKRILDPGVAVTVKDGGVAIAADQVTIDYLFGKFTLSGAPGGAVTVDASYIPPVTLAECSSFEVEGSANLLPDSVFGDTFVGRTAGLKTAKATVTTFAAPQYDHDTGAGTKVIETLREAGTPVLLSVRPGGSGDYFRGWFLIQDTKPSSDVDGLAQLTISLESAARTGTGQSEGAAFGWGT